VPTFVPGQTLLRRYWTGGRISVLNIHRVVADDELGLRLWLPAGTPYWRVLTADGRTQHEAPVEAVGESAVLTEVTWRGADVMVWLPPGEAYSVWWFWDPESGDFQGWYGNLEAAAVRWSEGAAAGVDTVDQALDLWVEPDGSWAWKDLDEFEERTGHELYWDKTEAARIREEGERLAELAATRSFPFDGTWTDFRPDPDWPTVHRPEGWDRPRAHCQVP
jgi:hypothetical protein